MQAMAMAEMLAQRQQVKIHLLHVIEANESVISGKPELAEAVDMSSFNVKENEARKYFHLIHEQGLKFEAHIRIGLLTDQIRQASADLGADLVIMGTKGADGWMEKISGSEAQHVVRHLEIPVITLLEGVAITDLRNILFVADFEEPARSEDISLVRDLAAAFNSTIHLLQIVTHDDEHYADQITSLMQKFAEENGLAKFETHLYRDSKVETAVRNFNRESEIDLVCIRTHSRKGISHIVFSSIAERLVNHCRKPLLTFQ